jgi:hypothetical protein
MKKIKVGAGFTIFVLFFGIALLDAFRTKDWLNAAFWLFVGTIFLVADNFKKA